MFFRCLLLVLVCLQDFTVAHRYIWGPGPCCFRYLRHEIAERFITDYKVTARQCVKPGVIFTLNSGRGVCADPDAQWVKNNMKILDQRLYESPTQPPSTSPTQPLPKI